MNYGDIVSVLKKMGRNHHSRFGEWVNCQCPVARWKHRGGRDRHPSFGIHINPNGFSGYNCYSCGISGGRMSSLVRVYAHYSGKTLRNLAVKCDALEVLLDTDDYVEERAVSHPLDEDNTFSTFPEVGSSSLASLYLRRRGVTEEVIELLRLRYDEYEQRVLFPVYGLDSKLYGLVGRTVLEEGRYPFEGYPKVKDYSFRKGQHLMGLQGLADVSEDLPVILVEGPFDLACLLSLSPDFRSSYGVPLAAMKSSLSEEQAALLVELGRKVYLMFDDDVAGTTGLFGRDYFETGQIRGGAYARLKDDLRVVVPDYPHGVYEPEDLTLEDVKKILRGKVFVG